MEQLDVLGILGNIPQQWKFKDKVSCYETLYYRIKGQNIGELRIVPIQF